LLHGVAGGLLIVVGLRYAWLYLAPFLIATVLAAIIDPLVNRLQGVAGLGRGGAVIAVLSVFLALWGGLLGVVVVNVTAELERLLADLPRMAGALGEALDQRLQQAEAWRRGLPHPMDELVEAAVGQASQAVAALVGALLGTLRAAPNLAFMIMVAGFATYFISRDRHRLWHAVLEVLPRAWRPAVVRLRDEIFGGVLALLRAQLSLVAVTGTATLLGLALLGVPYSWLLGLGAAVLDLIPMIGPGGVLAPVCLWAAARGDWVTAGGAAAVWLAVVLVRQWLEPHVLGVGLGLHPLPTLMAVYAAVQLTGPAGFVLGPMALVVLKAFFVVTLASGPARR